MNATKRLGEASASAASNGVITEEVAHIVPTNKQLRLVRTPA